MNIFKTALASAVLCFGLSAMAAEPKAEVIEHCSHDIMKLAKQNLVPADAVTKLHMMQVKELADGTFDVIAVLDHDGDHSQMPAHIVFKYGADAKMISHVYNAGFITPKQTAFTGKTTAKLFDIAAEVLLDSPEKVLQDYAATVAMMHLEFDAEKNAALFEMIDTNNKQLNLWLDLNGKAIEYKFVN